MKISGRQSQPFAPAFDALHGGNDPRLVFLTSQAACAFLGYTGRWRLRSLYRFIEANGTPKHYRSPRRFLLRLSDLLAVLKRGGVSHRNQSDAVVGIPSTSAVEGA